MNNNFCNIEIINFESMTNEMDHSCENNDIEMGYLNTFLLERYESEYENQYDSVLTTDNQSQMSFLSEQATKVNSSIHCMPKEDNLSLSGEEAKSTCAASPIETPSETPCETPEKHFRCGYDGCKKSFKFKWILDRHYLSHKSVKQYECKVSGCFKSYKSKENLTLHFKNIHLKEKPYSCRFCPSVFSHRNGKTYHERKFHTNYLPHSCQMIDCECKFASKSALTYHLKSQHSDKSSTRKSNKLNRAKFNQEILRMVNGYDSQNYINLNGIFNDCASDS